MKQRDSLKADRMLHDRYLVKDMQENNNLVNTYTGQDLLWDTKVFIREYNSGWYSLERICQEQRNAARAGTVPYIVSCRDTFCEKGHNYLVTDFAEGITLREKILKDGPMSAEKCINFLYPLMEGLAKLHMQGLVYRGLEPENIMFQPDSTVKLTKCLGDVQYIGQEIEETQPCPIVEGFSPIEQYLDNGQIGPWTDVYALCAVIYYAVTGEKLLGALYRKMEQSEVFMFMVVGEEPLPYSIVHALKDGLAIEPQDRIQSIEELLQRIE